MKVKNCFGYGWNVSFFWLSEWIILVFLDKKKSVGIVWISNTKERKQDFVLFLMCFLGEINLPIQPNPVIVSRNLFFQKAQ